MICMFQYLYNDKNESELIFELLVVLKEQKFLSFEVMVVLLACYSIFLEGLADFIEAFHLLNLFVSL